MSDWQNPNYSHKFYHLSRHAELVIVSDRDVVAFFADTVVQDPSTGMEIWRKEGQQKLWYGTDDIGLTETLA
jgi:hypothetical protein